LALLELLRRGLDLDVVLVALDDQVALVDRQHVLAPVEHDVGVGAVVGAQEKFLVEHHGRTDGELDSALVGDTLRRDVFERRLERLALQRTDVQHQLHALPQLADLRLVDQSFEDHVTYVRQGRERGAGLEGARLENEGALLVGHVEHSAVDGGGDHVRNLVPGRAGLEQPDGVLGRCHRLLLHVVVGLVLVELRLGDDLLVQQLLVALHVRRLVLQVDARLQQLRLRGGDVDHVRTQRDARNDDALLHGLAGHLVQFVGHPRDLRLHLDFAARDHLARSHGLLDDAHARRAVDLINDRGLLRFAVQEHQRADEHQRDHTENDVLDDSFHCSSSWNYSSCSATMGLTAAALAAGISEASSPEITSTTSATIAVLNSTSGGPMKPALPPAAFNALAMVSISRVPTTRPL